MAYTAAGLPLTGAGDATADVGVDRIAGIDYQMVKMLDGTEGSTIVFMARETTPGSTDAGLVVRPIGSTAHLQGIAGTVTVANPTTAVTVDGAVDVSGSVVVVANPSTAVDVSSGVILGAGSSANMLGRVAQGPGSTTIAPWYVISSAGGGGSTAVDLSSGGSTRLVGQVTVGNPTTAVTVSSGVVLGAGSSTNMLGAVAQGAGSTSLAPWYVISSAGGGGSTAVDLSSGGSTRTVGVVSQGSPAGTSADAWWVRSVTTGAAGAGSTTVDANLSSAGSTKTVGVVGQGPGSSAAFWFAQSIPFTSGNVARTSVATTVNAAVIAANANRKALLIANGSTAQMVGLGLSTATVTTARANVNIYLQANSQLRFGLCGDLPLYTGAIQGINLTSTAVAGYVIVTEFT